MMIELHMNVTQLGSQARIQEVDGFERFVKRRRIQEIIVILVSGAKLVVMYHLLFLLLKLSLFICAGSVTWRKQQETKYQD
jgi:hypothetical protein